MRHHLLNNSRRSAPAWRQALAGIASIEVPTEGIAGILPKLTTGAEEHGNKSCFRPSSNRTAVGCGIAVCRSQASALRVMLLYKRNAQPDEELLSYLGNGTPKARRFRFSSIGT